MLLHPSPPQPNEAPSTIKSPTECCGVFIPVRLGFDGPSGRRLTVARGRHRDSGSGYALATRYRVGHSFMPATVTANNRVAAERSRSPARAYTIPTTRPSLSSTGDPLDPSSANPLSMSMENACSDSQRVDTRPVAV